MDNCKPCSEEELPRKTDGSQAAQTTNSDLMPLLARCCEYINGVSGRSIKGDILLSELNAILAQQH